MCILSTVTTYYIVSLSYFKVHKALSLMGPMVLFLRSDQQLGTVTI
jgi:hypothetical protein